MRVLLALLMLLLAGCSAPAAGPDASAPFAIACTGICEGTVDDGPLWTFEPDAAADPTDPRHLVVVSTDFRDPEDLDSRWLFVHESSDGGASWTRSEFMPTAGEGLDHPFATCDSIFDPLAAFLPDGTLLVAGVAARHGETLPDGAGQVGYYYHTFVARRGGPSWSVAIVASHGEFLWHPASACQPTPNPGFPLCAGQNGCPIVAAQANQYADKPFLAVAPDGAAYLSFAPGAHLAVSRDGARTWSLLPTPEEPEGDGAYAYSLDLAAGPSGELYGAATNVVPNGQGGWSLRGLLAGSQADGVLVLRDIDALATAYPQVAVGPGPGPTGERAWLAYPRAPGGGSAGDQPQTTVAIFSDDGGDTWSAPLTLHESEEPGWAVPTLAVDRAGVAYSGAYVYRSNGTIEYRVAATDGQAVRSIRVDASPILRQGLGLQLGHYMGIAALADGGAFATWVSGEAPDTALRGAAVRAA